MKTYSLTVALVVILTATASTRSYGFIDTIFDNLQTQSTITRSIATQAQQDIARKRAEQLLHKHASLQQHRYIMVQTIPKEETASAPVEHKKATYVIYDTEKHTTADNYAYTNISAAKGSTVDLGGVDVCVAE